MYIYIYTYICLDYILVQDALDSIGEHHNL